MYFNLCVYDVYPDIFILIQRQSSPLLSVFSICISMLSAPPPQTHTQALSSKSRSVTQRNTCHHLHYQLRSADSEILSGGRTDCKTDGCWSLPRGTGFICNCTWRSLNLRVLSRIMEAVVMEMNKINLIQNGDGKPEGGALMPNHSL